MMNGKPGKGWVWSDRLQKWRRPAVRQFMADRQGIHIVLGLVVAGLGAGMEWAFGWGIATIVVLSALFCLYEVVEAGEISDDGYIDIGGYLGGLMAGAAGAVLAWGIWTVVQ